METIIKIEYSGEEGGIAENFGERTCDIEIKSQQMG